MSINRCAFQRRRDFLSPSFTPRVQRRRIQIAPDLTSGGRHDIKEQRSREGAGEIKEYERKQKGARSHFIFLFPRRRRRLMETLIIVGFFILFSAITAADKLWTSRWRCVRPPTQPPSSATSCFPLVLFRRLSLSPPPRRFPSRRARIKG